MKNLKLKIQIVKFYMYFTFLIFIIGSLFIIWRIFGVNEPSLVTLIIVPLLYCLYSIPLSIWIYLDSKKIFKSNTDEALGDFNFGSQFGIAHPTVVLAYLKKRELFLSNDQYRQDFLAKREVMRQPLQGESRHNAILWLMVLILVIYLILISGYFYPNNIFVRIMNAIFSTQ